MLKLIASLIPFIKEMFFDKKEEMDFTSPSFNPKKWIQYVSFIILFSLILFVGSRLIGITSKYVHLEQEFAKVEKTSKEQKDKIDTLVEELHVITKEKDTLNSHCYPYPAKKLVKK